MITIHVLGSYYECVLKHEESKVT